MRVLTAILAILGCPWVILGFWGATVMLAYPPNTPVDALHSSFTIALFSIGYFVWWGWAVYSFRGRFPLVRQKTFWIISLIQHVLSLLFFSTMDARGNPDTPLTFFLWVGGNALIAAIVLIMIPLMMAMADRTVVTARVSRTTARK